MLATPALLLALSAPPSVQAPSASDPSFVQLGPDEAIAAVELWLGHAEKAAKIAKDLSWTTLYIEGYYGSSFLSRSHAAYFAEQVDVYAYLLNQWPLAGRELNALGIEDLGPHTILLPSLTSGTTVFDLPGLRFEDLVAPGGLPPVSGGLAHSAMLSLVGGAVDALRADLADALRLLKGGQAPSYVAPALAGQVDVPLPVALDRCRRRARAAARMVPYYEALRTVVVERLESPPSPVTQSIKLANLQAEADALVAFLADYSAGARAHGLPSLTGAPLGSTTPASGGPTIALPSAALTPSALGTDDLVLTDRAGAAAGLLAIEAALGALDAAAESSLAAQQAILATVNPSR